MQFEKTNSLLKISCIYTLIKFISEDRLARVLLIQKQVFKCNDRIKHIHNEVSHASALPRGPEHCCRIMQQESRKVSP